MGTIFAYSLTSALLLATMYLVFKWMLAGENQHRYNRAILWLIYTLSLTLPALIPALKHLTETASNQTGITGIEQAIEIGMPSASIAEAEPLLLPRILLAIYIAGAAAAAVYTVFVAIKLHATISKGEKMPHGRYTLAITPDTRIAPFSWCCYIVMSRSDFETSGEVITLHETRHLDARHWVDLLLAQLVAIFQWYNPAAWLMREELKTVHEFQADEAVIRSGTDPRQYQMLLIKKAVGARFPSLANSLNHSKLKKRITMMYNHQTSWRKRVGRAFAVVPALAAAVALTHIPAVAGALDAVSEASLSTKTADVAVTPQTKGKVKKISIISETSGEHSGGNAMTVSVETSGTSDAKADKQGKGNAIVVETAAVMPKFPGGEVAMMRYLMDNLKFPEGSEKTGKVVVQFIVSREGKVQDVEIIRSVDPALDAEAVRVVSAMPDFEPGRNEKGETVAVHYVLPVSFATKGDDKDSPESKPVTLSDNVKVYIAGNPATREDMDKLDASRIKSMEVDKVNNVIHITLE